MAYYPLNRVQSNLYTAGGEYLDLVTNQVYAGYYHKLYNGKVFSGQTPYVENKHPLQKILNQETVNTPPGESGILDVVGGNAINTTKLITYPAFQNPNTYFKRKLPVYYLPQPTQQDYALGEIIRYFVKKVNQPVYLEVKNTTYDSIVNKDPNYVWENYFAFSLPWVILGESTQVAEQNKKITLFTEKTQKVFGLSLYLKENYTQFLQ